MIRRTLNAVLTNLMLLAIMTAPVAAQGTDEPRERHSDHDMVLIHGLGSSAAVWDEAVPLLELAFNVWTFELPGHGRTPREGDTGIDDAVARLTAYIEAEGIRYPVLVGHGIGGMVAMSYAFADPNAVDRVAVIDTAPRQLASAEQKAAVAQQLVENYDRFIAGYFLSMSPREEVNDQVVDQALRTDEVSFQQLLLSTFDYDVTEELAVASVPLLVIGSAMLVPDPAFAHERLDALGFGAARSISFKTMPQLGHFVMLEEPGYLASVLVGFAGMD